MALLYLRQRNDSLPFLRRRSQPSFMIQTKLDVRSRRVPELNPQQTQLLYQHFGYITSQLHSSLSFCLSLSRAILDSQTKSQRICVWDDYTWSYLFSSISKVKWKFTEQNWKTLKWDLSFTQVRAHYNFFCSVSGNDNNLMLHILNLTTYFFI